MTLAIEATARAMKAAGKDIISFGAGEPDFNTSEAIKNKAIEAIHANQTRYTAVGGTDALKDAIIQKLKNENGLSYERSQIIVSCGAKQSFYNLAHVLWEEGDEILIPAPYWVSYPDIITLAGATPVILNTTADADFKITPAAVEKATTSRTRALLINSPSNPTGSAYTAAELQALAQVAMKLGLLIVSDEIYEKILYDGFQQKSIASFDQEIQKNCVIINGVSKSYAMTGWRIGYMAADAEIVKQCNKLQGQSTSNPASISQAAAVEALTGSQDEVARMLVEFQKRRNVLVDGLTKIPGVSCYRPAGSFYSFPDFSALYGKTWQGASISGSLKFTEFLLKESMIALVPGIAFGADANARMAFACSMENINQGLDRLAKAIAKLE